MSKTNLIKNLIELLKLGYLFNKRIHNFISTLHQTTIQKYKILFFIHTIVKKKIFFVIYRD